MRRERFHMERDVLKVGDEVTIIEGVLPMSYYYTVVPALAMSGNYTTRERILSRQGRVAEITAQDGTFYVYIDFES